MIGLVQGTVRHGCVVTGCGVGYQVLTAEELAEGSEVELLVHHVLSETSSTLYGFADEVARDTFVALLGVQGVAGKTALSVLAELGVAGLAAAVRDEDTKALCAAKGVGAKGAAKIIVGINLPEAATQLATTAEDGPDGLGDLVAALVGLGYDHEVARGAARRTVQDTAQMDLPVEQQLKVALAQLAGA